MSHLAAWSKGGSRTGCSYRIAATAPSIDEVLKGREVRPCRPDPPSGSSSATSSSSARWGSADRSRSLATCNAISWTSVGGSRLMTTSRGDTPTLVHEIALHVASERDRSAEPQRAELEEVADELPEGGSGRHGRTSRPFNTSSILGAVAAMR